MLDDLWPECSSTLLSDLWNYLLYDHKRLLEQIYCHYCKSYRHFQTHSLILNRTEENILANTLRDTLQDDLVFKAAVEVFVRQDDGVEDDHFRRDRHVTACKHTRWKYRKLMMMMMVDVWSIPSMVMDGVSFPSLNRVSLSILAYGSLGFGSLGVPSTLAHFPMVLSHPIILFNTQLWSCTHTQLRCLYGTHLLRTVRALCQTRSNKNRREIKNMLVKWLRGGWRTLWLEPRPRSSLQFLLTRLDPTARIQKYDN